MNKRHSSQSIPPAKRTSVEDSASKMSTGGQEVKSSQEEVEDEETSIPPPAKRSRVEDVECASAGDNNLTLAAWTSSVCEGDRAASIAGTRTSARLSSRQASASADSTDHQEDETSPKASDAAELECENAQELNNRAKYPLETQVCKVCTMYGMNFARS